MEELKNEQLAIKIAEMGAELQSIQDTQGKEYLWQADEKYWLYYINLQNLSFCI